MNDAFASPQSVLVLGGGSDLGLAITRALVGRRARRVILAGRSPTQLKPAADELAALGANSVERIAYDALDPEGHDAVVDGIFDRFGDIDLALVAFGVLGDQDEAERDAGAALPVLRTNFVGAAATCLALARRLRAQGHGTLVVLSSVAGERVRAANFVYGASKAGIDGFCQGLGDSLAGSGVRVLIVRPGFVPTKMTADRDKAPFSTTPEGVAEAVVRGLEKGAEVVWAPPVLRYVMAVARHLPRPVFRRLKN
ncbi:MAG: decaprenylphospho-beta-D-erythro-pentofuranosid-2-ulose 2-reductase [Acidimicrobiia bacterium]